MYVAGTAPRKAERLIEVTHEALMRGIAAVKPGNTFGAVSYTHLDVYKRQCHSSGLFGLMFVDSDTCLLYTSRCV